MRENLSVGVFSLLLGASTLFFMPELVSGETLAAINDPYSPGFFPILIGTMLVVCGGVVVVGTAIGRSPEIRGDGAIESPIRLTATAALIGIYTAAMLWIGMLAASMICIAGLAYVLGYQRHWVIAAAAIGVPVLISVLFERLLYVLLPQSQVF